MRRSNKNIRPRKYEGEEEIIHNQNEENKVLMNNNEGSEHIEND